jgi:hypothetical protein
MERHPIFAALYDSVLLPFERLSFRPIAVASPPVLAAGHSRSASAPG